jgi:ABC-type spermidine/putrescine transport system permease subunit II
MSRFLAGSLAAGYAFLYLPIALLVATSFNASRLTTPYGPASRPAGTPHCWPTRA